MSVTSGAVVLVAKCPIPGKSKTRLSKLVGDNGSAEFAQAMLSDVLDVIGNCIQLENVPKILLYAPGTPSGAEQMGSILSSLDFFHVEAEKRDKSHNSRNYNLISSAKNTWILLPMLVPKISCDQTLSRNEKVDGRSEITVDMRKDLTSSNLGDKLESALQRTRSILQSDTNPFTPGNVVFLGMDSPIIPLHEIIYTLSTCSHNKTREEVHLCPAPDGGYGMISIPLSIPSNLVFRGVRWSNSLTAISQLKAITDSCLEKESNNQNEIAIRIGKIMHDVDEPKDVWELADTLVIERNCIDKKRDGQSNEQSRTDTSAIYEIDALSKLSVSAANSGFEKVEDDGALSCKHTWGALLKLGLVKERKDVDDEDNQLYYVAKDAFN